MDSECFIRGVSDLEFNRETAHRARPRVLGKVDPETGIQDGSYEAGLYVLSQVARPGQSFTQGEIAWACGVTRSAIFLTEQIALRKLRERMRIALRMDYAKFFAEGSELEVLRG